MDVDSFKAQVLAASRQVQGHSEVLKTGNILNTKARTQGLLGLNDPVKGFMVHLYLIGIILGNGIYGQKNPAQAQ